MSTSSRISVIMPVYNGEAFVEAAIESVLAQGGALEVLLHDDGSTDGTLDLLKRLARDETRLTVSSGCNLGPAAARNHCLDRATGDLIAFLDHDDLWPRRRLDRHIGLLAADTSAGAVLGHTLVFEQLGGDGLPVNSPRSRRVFCGLLQAALFRREALARLGGFDTSLSAADDFDLLLRFVESGWKLKVDPDISLYYRLHQGQWTADTHFASSQTVHALHRSLQRRRRDGAALPSWRL